MDSVSFVRNRADVNIQQRNTLEVEDTETVMADNEELDPPSPQDILNVFAAVDLSSLSTYDSAKYKRAWIKEKLIRSSILSAGECPDAISGALSIPLNHKEISPIIALTGATSPKNVNTIT